MRGAQRDFWHEARPDPAHDVCSNCQLYQGKPSDPWAVCPLLGGKQVNANGWCSAWVKKAV